MAYADDLVRELLVFRGFAHTLAAFEAELAADKLHPPQAQRVAQHIMRELIPALDWRALARLFLVLRERFVARADGASCAALEELEVGVQRLFMVTALRAGRRAEVVRVLEEMGESVQALLLAAPDDWTLWFAAPYLRHPEQHPVLAVYFTPEWADCLCASLTNFLHRLFHSLHIPPTLPPTYPPARAAPHLTSLPTSAPSNNPTPIFECWAPPPPISCSFLPRPMRPSLLSLLPATQMLLSLSGLSAPLLPLARGPLSFVPQLVLPMCSLTLHTSSSSPPPPRHP
ncbi:hypothetical protein CLOM_g21880 [Closterium sp. NIES-68]|nr:hypothetical protein CLOM_g21880 [Closterium sp. NIES-68]GJP69690.1 hypothetical protein CLOP_g676 [Closterium sp. NIES-67]